MDDMFDVEKMCDPEILAKLDDTIDFDAYWDITTDFIEGENALVIIKTGAGGTVNGYQDKYKKLASYIHEKTGYAVLIADNPVKAGKEDNFELTMTAAEFSCDLADGETEGGLPVYYIGFSSGAAMGAMYAYQYKFIKKMLLVNPPLNINWHKQWHGLSQFAGGKAVIAIGSKDPSYKYAGLIDCCDKTFVEKVIVDGMGHRYNAGMEKIIFDLLF